MGAAGASHESMKFRDNFGPAGRMSAIMSIEYPCSPNLSTDWG
ncbi:hypothetical protein BLSMQ_0179 [Brevibacterium aurantiacum]|uniref:Uncharacterized protein n=1 Tax=Brevibacterium aurantiacum TaxID=273384 RepID=A0A1D7VYR9_BREAU|nr:hypothetical protein BLSMQ_0179 [Brevibacterium aurantiacum]